MADTSRITRSKALEMAINGETMTPEAIDVLKKIKASVEKKNTSPSKKKVTDEQIALRNEIIATLSANPAPMSVTEMQKANPVLATCSTSKITANVGQMLVNGKVPNSNGSIIRSVDKKTAKFTLA